MQRCTRSFLLALRGLAPLTEMQYFEQPLKAIASRSLDLPPQFSTLASDENESDNGGGADAPAPEASPSLNINTGHR